MPLAFTQDDFLVSIQTLQRTFYQDYNFQIFKPVMRDLSGVLQTPDAHPAPTTVSMLTTMRRNAHPTLRERSHH